MAESTSQPTQPVPSTKITPQAQQSTYLLPTLRTLYTKSLKATLSKCSYPAFAACFPTPAVRKPETLKIVHRQIVEKVESKAWAEFEAVCAERDLDARLGELEKVVGEAEGRARDGRGGGGGPLHVLPPMELFLATLAPQLQPIASRLEDQIREQRARNEGLVREVLGKRAEIEGVVGRLEAVVRDLDEANGVLFGARGEMGDV